MKYSMTSGFETHVELKTKSKIFCGCTTDFGGEPNTHCCPVCMGHPGTLPRLNKKVVEFAVRAGLALNCKINTTSYMDRKNYSYPDLPKAYQISQFDIPLCYGGYIQLSDGRKIRINRIHIEEDAGKLIHSDGDILVDYNRAGVPLIEIVSEPDIKSVEEAKEFVEKLRLIMRYIGVSDCKMQEGSMRCDVNVSVSATDTLGTRTEIKNMNSISGIAKAMEYEAKRQVCVLESGGEIFRETLGFDEKTASTYSMRSKEDADDYRFFREPDLLPVHISESEVEQISLSLPELPDAKVERYVSTLGIEQKDAVLLTKYPRVAEFFERAIVGVQRPEVVANLILVVIFAFLKTEGLKEEFNLKITPDSLGYLVNNLDNASLSYGRLKAILQRMLTTGESAESLIEEENANSISSSQLEALCSKAIEANSKIVSDYKGGKDKAIMALVGFVMRESKGRADAGKVKERLIDLLR